MRSLAAISVLLVAACAGNNAAAPDLLPPEVTLTQIGVRNFGLTGGTLETKVSIRNPNSAVIRGTGITLSLDVQGTRFGTTDLLHGYEIAGDSTVTFVVPVQFQWSAVGLAARNVLNTGDVQYGITGHTTLLVTGRTWRFPFTHQGNVPVVRIP